MRQNFSSGLLSRASRPASGSTRSERRGADGSPEARTAPAVMAAGVWGARVGGKRSEGSQSRAQASWRQQATQLCLSSRGQTDSGHTSSSQTDPSFCVRQGIHSSFLPLIPRNIASRHPSSLPFELQASSLCFSSRFPVSRSLGSKVDLEASNVAVRRSSWHLLIQSSKRMTLHLSFNLFKFQRKKNNQSRYIPY